MGQNPTETLSEIEAARQRLQQDIDVLEQRLPPADELMEQMKIVGAVAAAALVGGIALYGTAKRSAEQRRLRKEAERQADALADVLAERRLAVEPDVVAPDRQVIEVRTAGGGGDATGIVALVAALTALAVTIAQFVSRRG